MDIYLTTAGTSCWEFLTLGGVLGVALGIENQRNNNMKIIENSLGVDLGVRNTRGEWDFNMEALKQLISDPKLWKILFEKLNLFLTIAALKELRR